MLLLTTACAVILGTWIANRALVTGVVATAIVSIVLGTVMIGGLIGITVLCHRLIAFFSRRP
jgi:hypothetical protein